MQPHNLGPHSYASPPHKSHHEWLTKFSPEQRHQLIREDTDARTNVAMVLAVTMLFGMSISLIVLIAAYFNGLL